MLSPAELRRRYPQMNPEGVGTALFEPTTGVLMAREGCIAVAEAFQKKGGRFRIGKAEPGRASGARLLDVALADGSSVAGSTFVFACGPWLGKVFPDIFKKKLFTPRRDVFFFGTPAGDDRFSYPNFPNYSEDASLGYYGFPSIDQRGFKVCPVGELTAFDPDTDERVVSSYQVKRARDYLALRFPALKDQARGRDPGVPLFQADTSAWVTALLTLPTLNERACTDRPSWVSFSTLPERK